MHIVRYTEMYMFAIAIVYVYVYITLECIWKLLKLGIWPWYFKFIDLLICNCYIVYVIMYMHIYALYNYFNACIRTLLVFAVAIY